MDTTIAALLMGITSLVIGSFTLIWKIISWSKARKIEKPKLDAETRNVDLETFDTYEEVLKKSNDRATRIESRLTEIELERENDRIRFDTALQEKDKQIAQLMDELKLRDVAILANQETIARLQDWAERLCSQIKSWGETPVPMDKPGHPKLTPAKS